MAEWRFIATGKSSAHPVTGRTSVEPPDVDGTVMQYRIWNQDTGAPTLFWRVIVNDNEEVRNPTSGRKERVDPTKFPRNDERKIREAPAAEHAVIHIKEEELRVKHKFVHARHGTQPDGGMSVGHADLWLSQAEIDNLV